MSGKFNGFTADEINRVSGSKKSSTMETMRPATFRGHGGIRRMPVEMSTRKQQQQITQKPSSGSQKINIAASTKKIPVATENPINEDMPSIDTTMEDDSSMSQSFKEALFFPPYLKQTQTKSSAADIKNTNNAEVEENCGLSKNADAQVSSTSADTNTSLDNSSTENSNKSGSPFVAPSALDVQSPFKGISLKDFESHRKMLQEQNRQKKEILYKAIEQHSQKTAAETRKIQEIKTELTKLDSDLAVDVAVLRKQIDAACIHFANIEKQYLKIEAQFLRSKIDLHNAAEKKELLTEHLCTVIAHNEDRKAQKLTELMEKVGLTASSNGVDYEPPSSTTSNANRDFE